MTVTYTAEVATCRGFGCFLKLLLRWRGSIYKLVWLDLLAFLLLYYLLNMVYRFALVGNHKVIFEAIVQYCYNYSDLIPLSFVLGFYVSIVMTRWWNQYISIPWPDPIAVFVSSNVHGQDERGRVMRRTIMRYVCLCLTMVLINVSPRVKKRFPGLSNLVDAGLLNENEKEIIESMNKAFPRHSKHWLPIVWAASIITRARKEGRIRDDFAVKTIIDELNKFRGQCGLLISYDTISVPLVYTQVVTLAVYSYFICSIMGQQWIEGKRMADSTYINKIDLYFPVFTTLQFFFYMGWLKVAESLINPFGEDDDDFEVNWMVDRNLQVSYLIVDEMHHDHPELIKDQYWDEIFPNELPYTVASERFREEHPEPSTAKIEVSKDAALPTNLSSVHVDEMVGKAQTVNYRFADASNDEEADDASGIHFTAGNGKLRQNSSASMVSIGGNLSRVNTVASALKRFLSREDSRPGPLAANEEPPRHRLSGSASTASLANAAGTKPVGSLRITDQVIEEVDEQQTITSQRGNDTMRPNVRDIFAPANSAPTTNGTPHSKSSSPIDIPQRPRSYTSATPTAEPSLFPPGGVEALLSTSAPIGDNACLVGGNRTADGSVRSLFDAGNKDKGSQETVEEFERRSMADVNVNPGSDEFEKLKLAREKERLERQKQKIVRTISTAPSADGGGPASTMVPVVTATLLTPTTAQTPLMPVSSAADIQWIANQLSNSPVRLKDEDIETVL